MASPTVEATNTSAETSGTTSHTVPIPDGSTVAGETLIVIFGHDDADDVGTFPANWNEILDLDLSSDDSGMQIFEYEVTGGESWDGTDDTITVTTVGTEKAATISYRISGAEDPDTQAPESSTGTTGTGDPNPDSITPTGGSKDYLFIAVAGHGAGTGETMSGAPTNYTDFLNAATSGGGGASNVDIASAVRQLTASSEDPGVFTTTDFAWGACTLAIHPAAAGTVVTPGVIAAVAALPAPTIVAGAVVTPSAIAATAALPATTNPQVVTTSTIAATATLPVPTLVGGAVVTPIQIAATAALPAVTIVAGAVVTPGAIAAIAALPAVTIIIGGTVVTPGSIAAIATLPAPTIVAGAVVTPAQIAAVATLPAPTIVAGAVVTPAPIAAIATLPAVAIVGSAIVTPSAIAAIAALPAVTIVVDADATVTPATIVAVVAFPGVTILVPVAVDQGNWYTLLGILDDARAELEISRAADPIACPNDGEPLLTDRHGLYCPYDGWRPVPIRFAEALSGGVQYGSYDTSPPGRVPFNR